jgi:death-on-curing protein
MAAYVFLARNGLTLTADEPGATSITMGLAAGELDEQALAAWLRDHSAA